MTGFRGATACVELIFDTTKPVALIFGENGTGKSTIADAFDFLCNRSYGSLEGYSLGEPAKKFVAALGGSASSVKVTLSSGSSTWEATLEKDGPAVVPKSGYPNARILRRRAILKLIEAQPKQRFEELKAFIAVPGIDKAESALREAVRTMDSAFTESTRALSQAKEALEELWTKEGKPGAGALPWAEAEAGKDITQIQAHLREMENLESAFKAADSSVVMLDSAREAKKQSEGELAEAEQKLKIAEMQRTQQNAELVKLLEEARAYVEKRQTLTQCPVCEQGVKAADLLRRLQERIKEMQELKALVDKVTAAKKEVHAKASVVNQNQKDLCERVKALALLLKASTFTQVRSLKVKWHDFGELLSATSPSDSVEVQARQLLKVVSPCRKPLQARRDADQKSVNHHNAIEGHVDTLRAKHAQATSQEALLQKLKAIHEIVSKERKEYIEGILASISGEVERLYGKLHPDEGIGGIRFYLKPNAIGSLEFDAHFQDATEVPPQAYYSESHLDTLGICVFLALAKFFKTDNTIVVLDDVLTSVDGPHLDRFMQLLHDEASHFNQFIVTTHYRPWRDRYRWAKGPTGNTQLIELGPWTLERGLHVGEFRSAIKELRGILSKGPFDRQAAASKAGIILESLLDFLTVKYRCAVPRNPRNEYTLGELAQGIDAKLGKELRMRKPPKKGAGKVDVTVKPLVDAAVGRNWVRNTVGCHFRAIGSEVTDAEVRAYCTDVLGLADNLICPFCQTLPTRRPSGSYWQCQCGELELYPLVYPGKDPGTVDDES